MVGTAAPASLPGDGVGINKVVSLDEAMAVVRPGTRLMMGEFVGAGEPARCIEWLLAKRVGDLHSRSARRLLDGAAVRAGPDQ